MSVLTTDQLFALQTRQNEIERRLKAGSLGIDDVLAATQGILDGVYPVKPAVTHVSDDQPSWYVSPEHQLERAHQLWPMLAFPEPPKDFVPATDTEVLLLHVPETFDGLWNKVNAPEGYTKWRSDYVKDSKKTLRLAPNKVEYTEPVWLGFDPECGKGIAPNQLWGQPNLAASEVFSALIQFPDWPLAWFKGASAPNLAGYQLKGGAGWSVVPCLRRWGGDRRLWLSGSWAGDGPDRWASPSVREC